MKISILKTSLSFSLVCLLGLSQASAYEQLHVTNTRQTDLTGLQTAERSQDQKQIPSFDQRTINGSEIVVEPEILLTEETCRSYGNNALGGTHCTYRYSNGVAFKIRSNQEQIGREFKKQTIVEEFDSQNIRQYKKIIREKIRYERLGDVEAKKTEFFDIVTRPLTGKITRAFVIREYSLKTQAVVKITWTHYTQIQDTKKAGLAKHVVLRYDSAGNPLKGQADVWQNGKFKKRIFDWSKVRNGIDRLNLQDWTKIESRITLIPQPLNSITSK